MVLNPDQHAVFLAVLDALLQVIDHPGGDLIPGVFLGHQAREDTEDRCAHPGSNLDPLLDMLDIGRSGRLFWRGKVIPHAGAADV